jgi:hypothetical protein
MTRQAPSAVSVLIASCIALDFAFAIFLLVRL